MRDRDAIAARVRRPALVALAAGLLAGAACAASARYRPAVFFPAYLTAWSFWSSISLGSLALAMIHHLSGGHWGLAIRRILEAAYSPLPLLALLFIPLAFGLPVLYTWARAEVVADDPLLVHKSPYLNEMAFLGRAALYFVVWTLLALVLNSLSAGPADRTARRQRLLALVSGPGLILWGLSVTFAAVDWTMSLEPHWFSSIYGVLLAAGHGVAALSLAVVVLLIVRDLPPWSAWVSQNVLNDLGNFLLAFVIFWTYIAFMQFLIIWSGNLPEEATWYLHRSRGGWQWIAIGLAGFHFAVPFLLLLARQTKRQPRRLLAVAGLLLVVRLVDWHWLLQPPFSPHAALPAWESLVAPLAVGGAWLAAFAWRLAARGALPVYESPEMEESARDAHASAPAGI